MSETKLGTAMNAFAPTGEIKGRLDLQANIDSLSCIIDSTQNTAIKAGTPVKVVATSAKLPHIVACASGDLIMGRQSHQYNVFGYVSGRSQSYNSSLTFFGRAAYIGDGIKMGYESFVASCIEELTLPKNMTVATTSSTATQWWFYNNNPVNIDTNLSFIQPRNFVLTDTTSFNSSRFAYYIYAGNCDYTYWITVVSDRMKGEVLSPLVTTYANNRYNNLTNFQEISIPNVVTSFGTNTFSGTRSLKKVVFPNPLGPTIT